MSGNADRDVEGVVLQVIGRHLSPLPAAIAATASLEEIGVDSMTLVDVVLELQEEYSVEFPDEALADIDSVVDLVRALRVLVAV